MKQAKKMYYHTGQTRSRAPIINPKRKEKKKKKKEPNVRRRPQSTPSVGNKPQKKQTNKEQKSI